MAAQLPAKLKTADCQRFATRAAQLEKYRPIVTYWCEYYILQQILSRNLHTADEECQTYAIHLMDKLEQFKTSNPTNDAITDDLAAKAYIENFALETFNRGDEAQRTNKVTRQTADTFQAAATFLDLLGIWGALEVEVAAKSKFAKFHALRIARAVKAGEDPNGSNPVIEEAMQPATLEEDGLEQELKDMGRQENGEGGGKVYRPPTVESAEGSMHPSRPGSIVQDDQAMLPPPPTRGLSSLGREARAGDHDVSPIDSTGGDAAARQSSIGGGYFPSVPDAMGDTDMTGIGGQDIVHEAPPASMHTAAAAAEDPPTIDPADFYNTSQPPTAPTPGSLGIPSPAPVNTQPPAAPHVQQPAVFPPPPAPPAVQRAFAPPPPRAPVAQGPPAGGYNTDDESVLAAQKHAKWAISALNFEDVGTAVKELRIALEALGAS